jgi:hypothetical protein
MPCRMRIVLASVIVVGAIAASGIAEAAEVMGAGIDSCGRWTSDRTDPHSPPALQDEQWVLGYLSAVGQMSLTKYDPLGGTDAFAVWAWVDNFCRSNPLSHIADAAETFFLAHPHP